MDRGRGTALERARALIDQVDAAPRIALESADFELDLTDGTDSPEVESLLQRVRGTSLRLLGDLEGAEAALMRAVDCARAGAASRLEGEALMSLGVIHAFTGRTSQAMDCFDQADVLLDGVERARNTFQRSSILYRQGDYPAALRLMNEALPHFEEAADLRHIAHTLGNRGVVLGYIGDLSAAAADLERAYAIHREAGLAAAAAVTFHNLGWVEVRAGELASGLERFHQTAAELDALGRPHWELEIDRCEALIAAGCPREAQPIADLAAAALCDAGNLLEGAEAHLMAAYVHVWCSDGIRGEQAALTAASLFRDHDRPLWAAAADALAIRNRAMVAPLKAADRNRLVALAETLAAGNHIAASRDALLAAGRTAIDSGDIDEATELLERISRSRSTGPLNIRLQAWLAVALVRLASGNDYGAARAARAGADLVARSQAAFGALDMRATVAANAEELFTLGLRLAAESGDPKRVFAWTERTRSGALRQRPVLPPADARLAALLRELRMASETVRELEQRGDPSATARRRQRRIEDRLVDRGRSLHGETGGERVEVRSASEVRSLLDGRTLVAFADVEDRRLSVVMTSAGTRLMALGETSALDAPLADLHRRLRRLAARPSAAPNASVLEAIRQSVEMIDAQLFGSEVTGPLVVVPTTALRNVPWGLLSQHRSSSITVSLSASMWASAHQRDPLKPGAPRAVIACGPDVDTGGVETTAVAQLFQKPVVLAGAAATGANVLEAMNNADVAHVIAHGSPATENPLFSSLRMADGPLYAYDLQRLKRTPSLIVLSSCDVGLSRLVTSEETLGMVPVLLAAGARSVVASFAPVPDSVETADALVALHQSYLLGVPAAEALLHSRPLSPLTALTCFGAG